jgi:GLPGLI family protein
MSIKILMSSFMLMLFSFIHHNVKAQQTNGSILYEVTLDIHRRIPKEREEMKAMIPQYRTENYRLFFSSTETLYKAEIDADNDVAGNQGGMRMMFRTPKSETYVDKASRERRVLQDFMNKKYLITDTLKLAPWKIGNEQMKIMGQMCQMAYYTDDSDTTNIQEITAWFALQMPSFTGPDNYGTLPGTVLAVDINNGERVYVARKIDLLDNPPIEIKKIEKGEAIKADAYKEMVRIQTEKMRAAYGPRLKN